MPLSPVLCIRVRILTETVAILVQCCFQSERTIPEINPAALEVHSRAFQTDSFRVSSRRLEVNFVFLWKLSFKGTRLLSNHGRTALNVDDIKSKSIMKPRPYKIN